MGRISSSNMSLMNRGPGQTVVSLLAGKSTENSEHEISARDLHHCELYPYTRYWQQQWPKSWSPTAVWCILRTVTPLTFPPQFQEHGFCAKTLLCLKPLEDNAAWLERLLCISRLTACVHSSEKLLPGTCNRRLQS